MSVALFPDIVVNGTTLTSADIAAEAQNHNAPAGKPGIAWRKAARALAIRHLLLEEAENRGFTAQPQEVAPGKVETIDEALIRETLDAGVTPEPVNEATLRAIYDRNPDAHRAPSLFQPAHILFAAAPDDEARQSLREHAEGVLQMLCANPKRFAEIARAESACASRDSNGQLGQISSRDTVPEFESALRAASLGIIHPELVETRYGFHILRLDARAEGAILPFDSVKPRLAEACEKANWVRAAQSFTADLLEKAKITGLNIDIAA
ncbi:MAG: peptidylprolyl isomerase [Paracoccaceae bacterium]